MMCFFAFKRDFKAYAYKCVFNLRYLYPGYGLVRDDDDSKKSNENPISLNEQMNQSSKLIAIKLFK